MMRLMIATISLLAAAGCPNASAAAPLQPGDFIVSDISTTALYGVSRASGQTMTMSSGGVFVDPTGVCVTNDGTIFVADQNALPSRMGAILRIDAVTGAQVVVTTGGFLTNPVRVMQASGSTLFVLDNTTNALVEVDRTTGGQRLVAQDGFLLDCVSMARLPNGRLLVVNRGTGSLPEAYLSSVDPVSGVQELIASGGLLAQADNVVVTTDGRIVVAGGPYSDGGEYHWPGLVEVNLGSGAQTLVAVGPEYGTSTMCLDFDGNIVYSNWMGILRCDPVTWTTSPIVANAVSGYLAIVPEYPVPAISTSWGQVKHAYR